MSADIEVEASCHCGAVRIALPRAPAEVTDCNCSICRRLGVLWAYYAIAELRFVARGETVTYAWGERKIQFHHCATCCCTTHWWPADPARGRCGINARLLELRVLGGARVRHLDGAGAEEYVD